MALQIIRAVQCLRAFDSYAKRTRFKDKGLVKKAIPICMPQSPENAGNTGNTCIPIPTIPTIFPEREVIENQTQNAGNENSMVLGKSGGFPIPTIPPLLSKENDALNTTEAVLGMPAREVLKIWTAEGKPMIHLGPGENCEDLEELLDNPNTPECHLQAIRAWLGKFLRKA